MAHPIRFKGSNFVFAAPPGRDDVQDLHVFQNGTCVVSAWQLTPEELAEVNRTGGLVWLNVMCGRHFFPSFVGSESVVRSVVVDYGPIW